MIQLYEVRSMTIINVSTWLNVGLFSQGYRVFQQTQIYCTSGQAESFSPRWYDEYPHLEDSIERDAVFCFVCSLFDDMPSKEKADLSWKTAGIRKWHKMKTVGKNEQGKLAQHFSSQSHKAFLGACCHFLQKTKHIDI